LSFENNKKSQKLDEGVPQASDLAISARTDRKRFPHRFAEHPHFLSMQSPFQIATFFAIVFLSALKPIYFRCLNSNCVLTRDSSRQQGFI